MQVTIIGKENGASCPGAFFRSNRPGPEQQLVTQFLATLRIVAPKGCEVTIFREPRIEAAYPDLVIVVWHVATTQMWNQSRADLTKSDICVMHYLANEGPSPINQLQEIFKKNVASSLVRLHTADMIRKDGNYWITKPLSNCFAARHIIAMEAKINEWQGALEQAYFNTWFASASYIIVPCLSSKSKLIKRAEAIGVGVQEISMPMFDMGILPNDRLPVSYASWLFNEWVWRVSQQSSMEQRIINGPQLAETSVS